jgi:lipopolysaccharide export system protein LptA
MRNTLGDLNNHLFAQLERLSDEDIKGEALSEEIERAKAVTSVANQIISNGTLVLRAQKFHTEYKSKDLPKPKMLEG